MNIKIKLNQELSLDDIEKLTNTLEKFNSNILLVYQSQEANCKSLINLLAIGISYMKTLEFKIIGNDEDAAAEHIKSFFETINQ